VLFRSARKAVDQALALAGGTSPTPTEGVVVSSPSSIDLGMLQTSIGFELLTTAASTETVLSVVSDAAGLVVTPDGVDAGNLGRYAVTVDRTQFSGPGPFFQVITVTLSSSRQFTIPVTVAKPAGAASPGASYGPMYVLLLDPDTGRSLRTIVSQPVDGRYPWSTTGFTGTRISIIAGGDLDNDGLICQRGEACGGYPVFGAGGAQTVIELSGNLDGLDFQVAPLASIAPESQSVAARGYRARTSTLVSLQLQSPAGVAAGR
jgi:serine protease